MKQKVLINELISSINQSIINKCLLEEYIKTFNEYKNICNENKLKKDKLIDLLETSNHNLQYYRDYWYKHAYIFQDKFLLYCRIYKLPFKMRLKFLFNPFCLSEKIIKKYCDNWN